MRGRTNLMRSGTNILVKNNNIELPKISTFSDGTDEEIIAMLNAHYNGIINISDYWSIGDSRNINLSAISKIGVGESHTAQICEFVIIGIEHDDLTNPINGKNKAAITIQTKGILSSTGYMNSENTNIGGWESCKRRIWCNNVFKNSIPEQIKNSIKPVRKKTMIGNTSTEINITIDECFLISCIEFGDIYKGDNNYSKEGIPYEYYKEHNNRKKSESSFVFTRTPYLSNYYHWISVTPKAEYSYSPGDNNLGLCPSFCL